MMRIRSVQDVTDELSLSADHAFDLSKDVSVFLRPKASVTTNTNDISQDVLHCWSIEFLGRYGTPHFNMTKKTKWTYPEHSAELLPRIKEILYRRLTYDSSINENMATSKKRASNSDLAEGSHFHTRKISKISSTVGPTGLYGNGIETRQTSSIEGTSHKVHHSSVRASIIASEVQQATKPCSQSDEETDEDIMTMSRGGSPKPTGSLPLASSPNLPQPTNGEARSSRMTSSIPGTTPSVKASQENTSQGRHHVDNKNVDTRLPAQAHEPKVDIQSQPQILMLKYKDVKTQTADTKSTGDLSASETASKSSNPTHIIGDGKLEVQIPFAENDRIFKMMIEKLKVQVAEWTDYMEGDWCTENERNCYQQVLSKTCFLLKVIESNIKRAAVSQRSLIS